MSAAVDTREIREIADRAAVFGTRTDEANALRACADEIDRLRSGWAASESLGESVAEGFERLEAKYRQAIADRDKWIHAEASATSAHIAMSAELVDARQQIDRLTAELAEARNETIGGRE